jgi:hypothetical protein
MLLEGRGLGGQGGRHRACRLLWLTRFLSFLAERGFFEKFNDALVAHHAEDFFLDFAPLEVQRAVVGLQALPQAQDASFAELRPFNGLGYVQDLDSTGRPG